MTEAYSGPWDHGEQVTVDDVKETRNMGMSEPVTKLPAGVRLVVADLAGTTVDFGSLAPVGAFQALFETRGVSVTVAQARGPMGVHKRDHIRCLTEVPAIASQWQQVYGRVPTEADVESMFEAFIPMQIDVLRRGSRIIDGVAEAARELQGRGIRMAVTTGYNGDMLELVLADAARQGLVPDTALHAAAVPAGRPAPWMIYRCMETLGVFPPTAVVKVGDTIADVQAGVNAGVWSVGVAATGNMLGVSAEEYAAMDADERQARLVPARQQLYDAGAHLVIDGFSDLPAVLC